MEYVVVAELEVIDEAIAGFLAALVRHAHASRTLEDGCFVFDVCQRPERPSHFLVYEVYRDAEAYQTHREMPSYQRFMATAKPVSKFLSRSVLQRLPPPPS